MCQLEAKSFVLSMCVWSMMMTTTSAQVLNTALTLDSLVGLLKDFEALKQQVISDKKVDLLLIEKGYVHVMRAIYFLTCASLRGVVGEARGSVLAPIVEVFDLLKRQLSSPYHENRLNSLYVLNELAKVKLERAEACSEGKEDELNVFVNCLSAELTAASLDDYRQKLVYLLRLDQGSSSRYFELMKPGELNFSDVIFQN